MVLLSRNSWFTRNFAIFFLLLHTISGDIQVRNVRFNCYNFECNMTWDAPSGFSCLSGQTNTNKNLIYSVEMEDWSGSELKIKTLPSCTNLTKCECELIDNEDWSSYEAFYFKIFSKLDNVIALREISFLSSIEVELKPPMFNVTLKGQNAFLSVFHKTVKQNYTDVDLIDFFEGHYPQYIIDYWYQGDPKKHIVALEASKENITLHLPDLLQHSFICFCVTINAEMYDSQHCHVPKCLKTDLSSITVQRKSSQPVILTLCIFSAILAVLIVYYILKQIKQYKKKISNLNHESIPQSLIYVTSPMINLKDETKEKMHFSDVENQFLPNLKDTDPDIVDSNENNQTLIEI